MSEWEALLRLGLAVTLGGVIGFERATLDKGAGMRTHMLVCLGSALFMVASMLLVEIFEDGPTVSQVDPTRIASTIVTGVGFLGAGLIFRNEHKVMGLTTAAGLWVAAAMGMTVGAGLYITAIGGAVLTLIVLAVMHRVEVMLDLKSDREELDRNLPGDDNEPRSRRSNRASAERLEREDKSDDRDTDQEAEGERTRGAQPAR